MESRPNNHFFGFGYGVIEGLSPVDIVDISVTEIQRFKTCDFVLNLYLSHSVFGIRIKLKFYFVKAIF